MNHDRELDNYLQGKTDLSRLYADVSRVEPPEHLDAAILAEAHRAVNARPGAKPKRRWAIPLGMVASLFAIVMIGLQLPYMLKESIPLSAPTETKVTAAMDESAAEPASRVQLKESRANSAMDKAKSEIASNKPASVAAEAYVQPAVPMVAAPMAASPAPAPVMAAKRLEMRESAETEVAGVLSKEKKSVYGSANKLNDALAQPAVGAAGAVVSSPVRQERALQRNATDEAILSPEEWLKRIKKLEQEGNPEEARKELATFKKRYPAYSIPAALEIR